MSYLRTHSSIKDVILGGYWRRTATGDNYENVGAYRVDDQSKEVSREETAKVFARSLQRIAKMFGRLNIYVVQDAPEVVINPPNMMARRIFMGRNRNLNQFAVPWDRVKQTQAPATAVVRKLARAGDIKNIPIDDILCPVPSRHDHQSSKRRCPITLDGHILYRNGDHLSAYGASLLIPRFKAVLARGLDAVPLKPLGNTSSVAQ